MDRGRMKRGRSGQGKGRRRTAVVMLAVAGAAVPVVAVPVAAGAQSTSPSSTGAAIDLPAVTVTGTGEIIITGMIDLPRVVSSTGTVPTVHESPDIDDLFEPGELPVAPPDAAPVSAAKAVSVHTQAQTIITPTGSRVSSNAVTTALVAATVVMAVVAIGLFVVAAVNGLF